MAATNVRGAQIADGANGVSLTQDVNGVLPVTNGGTGLATPGASGNVLTSNGSAWLSSAPAGGGAPNTTIVQDDFDRADSATTPGTPDVGPAGAGTGSVVAGISANRFYFVQGAGSLNAYTYQTSKTDLVAEVTLPVVTTAESPGLALRVLNQGSNADGIWFYDVAAYQRVANVEMNIGTYPTGMAFVGGDRMRVAIAGREAKVYKKAGNVGDWHFVARYTLPSALDAATFGGLGRWGTGAGSSRYEDLWIGEMTDTILRQNLNAEFKSAIENGTGVGSLPTTAPNLTAGAVNMVGGSLVQVPNGIIKVGSRYRWSLGVAKTTAAGAATWVVAIRYGTSGSTSDPVVASWTSATNTAAIDQAILTLDLEVLTIGASATMKAIAMYTNTLTNVTGMGKISPIPTSTAAFNTTLAGNPFFHVSITPGTAAVMTAVCSAEKLA